MPTSLLVPSPKKAPISPGEMILAELAKGESMATRLDIYREQRNNRYWVTYTHAGPFLERDVLALVRAGKIEKTYPTSETPSFCLSSV